MRRLPAVMALLATALWAATAARPRVPRAALAAMEKIFDSRIENASAVEPFELLGNTRGVYLEGYGAVLTTEVNLIVTPGLSPFRAKFTKEEISRIRARKIERLPLLRQKMREMLLSSAAALDTVPANEQIVLAVSLFYLHWEDTTGLPAQIIMQGERQKLLSHTAPESYIRTEEY